MKQDNKTTRESAIEYFNSLSLADRICLLRNSPEGLILENNSRSPLGLTGREIELLYNWIHECTQQEAKIKISMCIPEQAIKEDGCMDMSFLDVPVGTNEVDDVPTPQEEESQDNSKEGEPSELAKSISDHSKHIEFNSAAGCNIFSCIGASPKTMSIKSPV